MGRGRTGRRLRVLHIVTNQRGQAAGAAKVTARILVVDDEPQIRRVLRATLTAEGYEVQDARTGEDALTAVRKGRFDLTLLDMNMPGRGGWKPAGRFAPVRKSPL